jgi:hypothetical protein
MPNNALPDDVYAVINNVPVLQKRVERVVLGIVTGYAQHRAILRFPEFPTFCVRVCWYAYLPLRSYVHVHLRSDGGVIVLRTFAPYEKVAAETTMGQYVEERTNP